MDIEKLLATRNQGVEWSGIRIMFALADKIDGVVNLGIGQPDFDTPEHIRRQPKLPWTRDTPGILRPADLRT